MDTAILVALITGGVSLLGAMISAKTTQNKIMHELEIKQALTEERFKQIESRFSRVDQKLDTHNGYAEKFAEITSDVKLLTQAIDFLRKGTNV